MSAFHGRFGAQARAYRAFRPTWPEAVFAHLLARVPAPRARALDLGAGTGLVAARLAREFAEVVALEPDGRMLAELEPRAGLTVRNERAEDARFEPATFTLVTAGNAFHWMEGEEVLARVFAWLAPGGTLALFRYDPPYEAEGPVGPLLKHAFEQEWQAHVHPRLRDPDYARRTLAASPFGPEVELERLANLRRIPLAELLGFLRSTSYAGGFARAQADPEGYWRALEARIVSAAGPGPFTFDFAVELLLARRP